MHPLDVQVPDDLKALVDAAAAAGSIYSGVGAALQTLQALLSAAGVLTNDTQVLQRELQNLSRQLDAVAGALSWQISEQEREDHFANSLFDVTDAAEQLRLGSPYTSNSPTAADAAHNANDAWTEHQFLRYFSEAATDGEWKNIMWQRPQVANGFVYDWRLGVPMLMQQISLRLQIIAAIDQNFARDHVFDQELTVYRVALQTQLQNMVAGVQCDTVVTPSADMSVSTTWTFQVACADVYTGVSQTTTFWADASASWPTATWDCTTCDGNYQCTISTSCMLGDPEYVGWYQSQLQPIQDSFRRQVLLQMPLFQMQRMIDVLYVYMHPQADLTQTFHRIALQQDYGLCLDVQYSNAASGAPVWIWACNATNAQQWVYDRTAATIVNPAFNKCLDVQYGGTSPGTPVWTWDCNGSDGQKWTYDPETHVLQSALGNALDVQDAVFQPGTPVWTWPRYGGPAQQWYADQPSSIIRRFF